MNKGVQDVQRTWSDIKRIGFSDGSGNYGYKDEGDNKFKDTVCTNIEDYEEKLECADAKFSYKSSKADDDENRRQFALMDIAEACREGKLCYGKDEDGVPQSPNEICVNHDKCNPEGANLGEIYPDAMDFYTEIKNIIFGFKEYDDVKSEDKKKSRSEAKKEIRNDMRRIIKEYNEMPYPITDSDSIATQTEDANESENNNDNNQENNSNSEGSNKSGNNSNNGSTKNNNSESDSTTKGKAKKKKKNQKWVITLIV